MVHITCLKNTIYRLAKYCMYKKMIATQYPLDVVKYLRETGVKVSNEEKKKLEKITYDEDL